MKNTIQFNLFLISILLFVFYGCLPPSFKNDNWSKDTLNELTLREKIAQMMIYRMNLRMKDIPSDKWKKILELIDKDGIGGLHFWYGESSTSLTMLNTMQSRSKVPILVDADIEHGLHQRFPEGTEVPPFMAIAASNKPENAYEVGRIVAKESRAVGIHWNFSPVVDVNNNPKNPIINVRSFSEDPSVVSLYATQYILGMQNNGLLATAKHFPGHGDTETDSHSSLAMIPSDSSRLWEIEIPPFQDMIEKEIDAIMVAHVHSPDYQPESYTPASMSKFWVNDILKEKLKFGGAIVTDGMGMGGIVRNYSDAYALIEVINAGCDIIIQNNDIEKSINTVEQAVIEGKISEERINEAALKMLKMKEKIGLHLNNKVSLDQIQNSVGIWEHKKIANEIATQSITCVRLNKNLLPLPKLNDQAIYVIDMYDHEFNHSMSITTKGLKKYGLNIKPYQIDESDTKNMIDVIIDDIPQNSTVLINAFVSHKAWKDRVSIPENEEYFIKKLLQKTKNIILGSIGNPYIIEDFPDIPVYLCAYKNSTLMQNAYLNAILGKNEITGRLPISIPEAASFGQGIQVEKFLGTKKANPFKPGKEIKQMLPSEVNANIDLLPTLLQKAVDEKAFPGGVLLASKDGKIFFHDAFGFHTYDKKRKMRESDIFDLASISKVVGTTSAIMKMYDDKLIDLDDKVVTYLPQFKGKQKKYFNHKSNISIKHLLTHSSGLPPFRKYFLMERDKESVLDSIYNTEPIYDLEEKTVYSDVGIITLGKIVEKVSLKDLDIYVEENISGPLGMHTTFFNPPQEKLKRVVPTEIDQNSSLIKGYVHDENAYMLGGVAGHAGLFSTSNDLATFSQMMLNGGIYRWKRIFKPETVALFTSRSNIIEGSSRCYGWDSPSGKASGGVYISDDSFGHTGFTGTSLWIDKENGVIVILLTNAVHPKRESKSPKYFDWRQRIHSAVYESLNLNKKNENLDWRKNW